MRLQEAVYGQHDLVEAVLLPPHGVGCGLKFWEGGGNLVFTKVKCTGDHDEGRRRVQGRGGIVLSASTSGDAEYYGVGGRHSGEIVPVGGDFDRGLR